MPLIVHVRLCYSGDVRWQRSTRTKVTALDLWIVSMDTRAKGALEDWCLVLWTVGEDSGVVGFEENGFGKQLRDSD